MKQEHINLVNSFKKLDNDDKKNEILKNVLELLKLLYITNKSNDNYNLPISNNYEYDSEYYDMLFAYIISIKEENAKLIDNIFR